MFLKERIQGISRDTLKVFSPSLSSPLRGGSNLQFQETA